MALKSAGELRNHLANPVTLTQAVQYVISKPLFIFQTVVIGSQRCRHKRSSLEQMFKGLCVSVCMLVWWEIHFSQMIGSYQNVCELCLPKSKPLCTWKDTKLKESSSLQTKQNNSSVHPAAKYFLNFLFFCISNWTLIHLISQIDHLMLLLFDNWHTVISDTQQCFEHHNHHTITFRQWQGLY